MVVSNPNKADAAMSAVVAERLGVAVRKTATMWYVTSI
jgi:hypothetical protein